MILVLYLALGTRRRNSVDFFNAYENKSFQHYRLDLFNSDIFSRLHPGIKKMG